MVLLFLQMPERLLPLKQIEVKIISMLQAKDLALQETARQMP